MQASLRLQQEYAGLVARGDELIVSLRANSDEPPAWATFDEDTAAGAAAEERGTGPAPRSSAIESLLTPADVEPLPSPAGVEPLVSPAGVQPSSFDLVSAADPLTPGLAGVSSVRDPLASTEDLLDAAASPAEAPVPGYDGWTVAQLRARLRRLSPEQLALLLAHEQVNRQRTPYLTMLRNRLAASSKGTAG